MAPNRTRFAVQGAALALCVVVAAALLFAAAGAGAEGDSNGPPRADGPSPCSEAISARRAFERTWRAVRRYFGAGGMPPPRLSFVDRPIREMQVSRTAAGYRRVEVFGLERLALAGERGCREALSGRESLIHEFVHVFQAEPYASGEIRPDNVFEEIPEGLAEARAQSLMRKVYGLQRGEYDEGIWAVYDSYARQTRGQYPPSLIRRGQFGHNWGRDPRLIPWREPNPVLSKPAAAP